MISIWRIITLPLASSYSDGYYKVVPLAMLSVAEPTSAVICACVPLLRPLLSSSRTTRYTSQGSRRPLSVSAATVNSVGRRDLTPSMPQHSPTSPVTPQMAHIPDIGGSINGDIEGYISSQQARKSFNGVDLPSTNPSSRMDTQPEL